MRKNTKKAVCIFFAVLLLVCSFPISAFAVDPVSASVIANSFAQAITAYGASNGVSLTFDGINSGNTDQIGEQMHELWSRFRAGQQTADDYDTIAAAVFPGLYNKVIKAGGAAVVGMSIAQEYMPDVDGFWNWLLSGPAEMVKVDNAYEWNINSNGVVVPIMLNAVGCLPVTPTVNFNSVLNQPAYYSNNIIYNGPDYTVHATSLKGKAIAFAYQSGSQYGIAICTPESDTRYATQRDMNGSIGTGGYGNSYTVNGVTYGKYSSGVVTFSRPAYTPLTVYQSLNDGLGAVFGVIANAPSISVQPYVGDAVAKPVPLPDVGDPDYGPVPWAGDLDVPWNDTLFGDGTGTLTDAQKGAITEELDGVIEDDGTLTLEGDKTAPGPDDDDDPPSDDPDDYGVVGLENIFPFCIPFDIYNFLNALAANPTAPHFTATLQLPAALGGAQTIDLDFDNPTFNQLAQLLRLLELLAFIVGLALLTRSMFIRG